MKFEIYKDKAGHFRVRLVAKNGNTICSTEGYTTKSAAKKSITTICSASADTPVVEM